jgi:hypothetical protein
MCLMHSSTSNMVAHSNQSRKRFLSHLTNVEKSEPLLVYPVPPAWGSPVQFPYPQTVMSLSNATEHWLVRSEVTADRVDCET